MNQHLTFTLIQSPLHWENKMGNLKMFEQKIRAINTPTEIVVLPEMFTTGFSMNPVELAEDMDGESIRWMKQIAFEKKIILTGSLIIQKDGKFFNRLIWMLPDNNFGFYDKRHLFSHAGEHNGFSAGNKKLITSVKGWKICTQICYDLRFPVWNRQGMENDYDVLLFVANWPEKRIHAWLTLLQARAIENQCFVVAVNRVGTDGNGLLYSGESCVISPMGEIVFSMSNREDIATLTLHKKELMDIREKFQFLKDKDDFIIL